jgi:hypothetical protein
MSFGKSILSLLFFLLQLNLYFFFSSLAAGQAGHPGHSAAATNDSELLTPLSAGSGSFHTNGSPAVSPHEWSTNGSTGYNPYFSGGSQGNGIQGPATPSEGMYSAGHGHVMT